MSDQRPARSPLPPCGHFAAAADPSHDCSKWGTEEVCDACDHQMRLHGDSGCTGLGGACRCRVSP